MIGKSSCSSLASSAAKRSKTSLMTSLGRASGLSTLLMQTIGFRPILRALPTTNFVCGIGPSAASTSTMALSTMERMRSTSPPKSAWPGVSTMLMRVSFQTIEVAFAMIVMPRSFSRSFESITRSATRWFSRKAPDCCRSRSTSVVLPWSTWAMMAILRSFMGKAALRTTGAGSEGLQRGERRTKGSAMLRCGAVYRIGGQKETLRLSPLGEPGRSVGGFERELDADASERQIARLDHFRRRRPVSVIPAPQQLNSDRLGPEDRDLPHARDRRIGPHVGARSGLVAGRKDLDQQDRLRQ